MSVCACGVGVCRYLVDRGCVLVGHGLKKDFRIMNVFVAPSQVTKLSLSCIWSITLWDSRRPSASRVPCAFPSLSFFYTPLTHLSLSLVLCVGDRYGGPVVVGESAKDLPPLPRLLLARGAHSGNAIRMILCIDM